MEYKLNYTEAQDIILSYAPEISTFFSDKWERWPDGTNGRVINECLSGKIPMWKKLDTPTAEAIQAVIDEINRRIK